MHTFLSNDSYISNLDLTEESNYCEGLRPRKTERYATLASLFSSLHVEKPSEECTVRLRGRKAVATPHSTREEKRRII